MKTSTGFGDDLREAIDVMIKTVGDMVGLRPFGASKVGEFPRKFARKKNSQSVVRPEVELGTGHVHGLVWLDKAGEVIRPSII